MYLDDIQRHSRRGDAGEAYPRYAFRVWYVPEDAGGSEVSASKKFDGIFALTDDEFVVARDYGWARTIVEGGLTSGCQAEPVIVSVKGKKVAAFRITGSANGLYAMDPAIGTGATRVEIRNCVVGRINGEVQAAPGERDIPGPGRSAVVRLVGEIDSADLRNPVLDAHGLLKMRPGEECLYYDRHDIVIMRNEAVAYGSAWQTMPSCSSPAEVWVTNRRIAVSWPDWSADPVSTLMVERRRRAGYRDEGKGLAVAGHLTWAWISDIFVGTDKPPGKSSLEFQATDRDTVVRIRILGLHPGSAESLLPKTAASVAAYRIETDDSLTAEERATLASIRDGRAQVEDLSWGKQISLPSSYLIGRDPINA
jgi:hypothetical protein